MTIDPIRLVDSTCGVCMHSCSALAVLVMLGASPQGRSVARFEVKRHFIVLGDGLEQAILCDADKVGDATRRVVIRFSTGGGGAVTDGGTVAETAAHDHAFTRRT